MIHTLLRRLLHLPRFLRFCLVGGVGFLVDATLFELVVRAGMALELARIVSLFIAMQVTYRLHRAFTFGAVDVRGHRPWMKFMVSNALGAVVNYLAFLLALRLIHIDHAMLDRQAAVAVGAGVAMFFNYWANKSFVFRVGRA